jgi:hypothetical protein
MFYALCFTLARQSAGMESANPRQSARIFLAPQKMSENSQRKLTQISRFFPRGQKATHRVGALSFTLTFLHDSPVILLFQVSQLEDQIISGSDAEMSALGAAPLCKDLSHFQALILPVQGGWVLGILAARVTFDGQHG